ncbi:hypothetical protein HELRODRAFT_168197 [Helobdella robusta]|uniref:Uncharacterized protein n=1 Tax=Helobdella robusta TaxID=6412 RepID=T1F0A6_HELRO|nr:hypothetical protein HELRODRAFT_168197 [Helobdella robusta]ESO09235.1 hypothetical protein HELRODRAFT_168197 [Helobdella robusta]
MEKNLNLHPVDIGKSNNYNVILKCHLTIRQEHHHSHHHYHHYQPIINITHHVGSLVHLPCDLNLSLFFLNTSSHVIAWKKQDLGIPIIVIFSVFPPRIEEEYQVHKKGIEKTI